MHGAQHRVQCKARYGFTGSIKLGFWPTRGQLCTFAAAQGKMYRIASLEKLGHVQLTMRTNQDKLSVRFTAAVIARPARPALTGSNADTMRAVANTTVLLMKSILTPSHLFMICRGVHSMLDITAASANHMKDRRIHAQ